ncbi:uncharacterized protein LOC141674212 [Apium graveolens]|uniref:uncharacterized protein LOC141674212 n=1 Tax=Apium graveolens TaxID=4045 RepID=UPI003D7A2885
MWKEKRVNKNVTKGTPIFSIYCLKGTVKLPPIPPTPPYLLGLYNDPIKGPNFHRLSRLYNAMFAFTSTGGNIDHSINNGRAPYVQQRDLYESEEVVDLEITLEVIRSESDRDCHISSTDEVAGIMVGDTEDTCGERDIVVHDKIIGLVRVSYVHPKLMALQYPLLFPRGEDGFHPKIKFQKNEESKGLTPRLGGRLFQQYLVDAFSSIEHTRLWWFRTHQTTLGNELYSNICDLLSRGDVDTSNTGKGIILPAGFVGSKWYMQQNFQDALAVCRFIGHPDIILTMTCNPLWDEIQKMMEYLPGCIALNCPDIISRVFRLKLDQLLEDIKTKKYFGVCNGVMYVVEFQKRGLPHVHMLIWLDADSKKNLKQNMDKYVSAEISNPLLDLVGYAAVKEFMIHGPCGLQNLKSPCMKGTVHELLLMIVDSQFIYDAGKILQLRYVVMRGVSNIVSKAMTVPLYISIRKKQSKNDNDDQGIDEINAYFDGRYLCGAEAAYRIFGFPIHHRSLSVERLPFHIPGAKNCTFRSTEVLGKVVAREKDKLSKLESLRTVNGVIHSSFREACKEYGLLDDDKEWHKVLSQACTSGLPPQIRQLFIHIIVNCKVTNLKSLWLSHWRSMVEDILLKRRHVSRNSKLTLNDTQLQFYALAYKFLKKFNVCSIGEIDDLLRSIGKSLKKYDQLLQPPSSYLNNGANNLIVEETSYDFSEMDSEHHKLLCDCTEEQRKVYDAILKSTESGVGGLFFVYGSRGCGKTFLWRTLICKLRSQGKIVLPVTSSGIAATLMSGGRTAHSRFKIPIVLDEFSTCNISHNSDIAQLIKQTNLIIWDEAPMQHRYAFKCLDRSLKDIMKSIDPARYKMPFRGITVVLGGDFRQILPVIIYGDRANVVAACITRSKLWLICHIFLLTHNMRVRQGQSDPDSEDLKLFAQWVLDIGNGQVPLLTDSNPLIENQILIPSRFCELATENTVENMISSTFPDFSHNGTSSQYLSERAILTPTNQTVGQVNSVIVDMLPGESMCYLSVDLAEEFGGTDEDLNQAFPVEYLTSLNVAGLPYHDLKLKVGSVVMLMQNLNQILGLCNGTRMIITKCLKFCVDCEVICGTFADTKHFIPRMELSQTDTKMPFKLVRKQMPLQLCYAMTINKSQGQSLKKVGLYLPKSVFTHGQYYVAVSRVTSPSGMTIFVDDESGVATNVTQNVV